MIGRSVFVCFVLVNLSLYGCDAVSAAIMVGRSVFVCLAFVNLSLYGCDAVSAAIMVGRSVFVCFCLRQFVALRIGCRVSSDKGWKIRICVFAFVSLSLSGFGAVQVWKRVNPVRRVVTLLRNMAGAGEVSFLRVCAERPCCLLLSGFFSIVCILSRSRIVRGPVVCSAHECSQLSRWLLDWLKYGQCCYEVLRTKLSCPVVVVRVRTLHLCAARKLDLRPNERTTTTNTQTHKHTNTHNTQTHKHKHTHKHTNT